MKVFLVRTVDENIEGSREAAIVTANDLEQLFWILDQFGDPNDYEYTPAKSGDAIFTFYKEDKVTDENGEYTEIVIDPCDRDEFILSDNTNVALSFEGDRKWKKMSEYAGIKHLIGNA